MYLERIVLENYNNNNLQFKGCDSDFEINLKVT